MVKEIRFVSPTGPYWFLSPYAEFPITMNVDGKVMTFQTVEHYYQSMKFYSDDPRFDYIRNLKNPDDTRIFAKQKEYQINRRVDFDKIKFQIMQDAMTAKFQQNPDAKDLLLSTGDAVLIKSCKSAGFECYQCGFGEGSGLNTTGKILMKIRDDLRK
ncbi:MAG: NADAR family protein [Rickettsiales bacterium]|nr:NADAR family protein [Rickettsiales bacterium]